jgi:ribosomal protein L11 methyltransferase
MPVAADTFAVFPMDYSEYRIALPRSLRQPMIEALLRAGALGAIEEPREIAVYFPASVPRAMVLAHIGIVRELLADAGLDALIDVREAAVPSRDWNASWKQGFRPIDIGDRFTVLPPWERPPVGRLPLIIDPGMAFGTGHHETTRSCLLLMERYAPQGLRRRFLDLGTGTGLLAIAALRLGFQEIDAVDHDEQAIASARVNLALNEAAQRISLRCADISAVARGYDMVAANLISGTLITLAPEIVVRLEPGGHAVLSGILAGQEQEVIDAMEREGAVCQERLRDGKWVSLVIRR